MGRVRIFIDTVAGSLVRNRLTVVGCLAVALIVLLVIYGLLAAPIADDWAFYNAFRNLSLIEFIDSSMAHTGRITQWLVIYVGYLLFDMRAVKILPIALLLGLIASLYFMFRQVRIFRKPDKASLVVVACIIATSMIFTMPSIFDSFLWYDSSASYIVSLILLFVNIALAYRFVMNRHISKTMTVVMVASLFFGQLASEPTSLIAIAMALLATVSGVFYKKKAIVYRLVLVLGVTIASFMILLFSKGSIERRATSPAFNINWVFIQSFDSYAKLFTDPMLWTIFGVIVFLLGVVFHAKLQLAVGVRSVIVGVLTIAAAVTYPIFVVNNYSQSYLPYRVLTISSAGIILSIFLLGLLTGKFFGKNKVIIASSLMLMIIMMPFIIYRSSHDIAHLALRDKMVKLRDMRIRDDKEALNNGGNITVFTAPRLMRGDAEDFYYAEGRWNKSGRIWVANTYLEYMGIDSALPKERIRLVDPRENYW